ncbi:helix-loop-helix domain-containing protein, partial [Haloarchaeobius amylolyticus]
EGAVFEVTVDRDEERLLEATYRADAERNRRESIQERFDRLSERLPSRDEEKRDGDEGRDGGSEPAGSRD